MQTLTALVLGSVSPVLAACQTAAPVPAPTSPPELARGDSTPAAVPIPHAPATQTLPSPKAIPSAGVTPALAEPMEMSFALDIPCTGVRTLVVFVPAIADEWPLVVSLHGGNVTGQSVRGLAQAAARQGAEVFAPNDHSSAPTSAEGIANGAGDAACALRFARSRAVEHGGTPDRVIAVGHSAGGAFAAVIALAGDDFLGDCLVSGGSALPDGMAGLDGADDLLRSVPPEFLGLRTPEAWERITPFTCVGREPARPAVEFVFFAGAETELAQNAQALRCWRRGTPPRRRRSRESAT